MTKSKKAIFGMLSMLLVAAVAVAGVVMWLMDTTDTVKNTFTVGNIDIELAETNVDGDSALENAYKMVPGNDIDKDPKVTVKANSEASYVFVKIVKSANFNDFLEYAPAAGWTPLAGEDGVYYRLQDATTADVTYSVLDGDEVTVKDSVTKEMMDGLTEGTYPTLEFTAYAIQQANIADESKTEAENALAAWTELNKTPAENA